jgi:transcriptional regulator with XRE-family HTH domain
MGKVFYRFLSPQLTGKYMDKRLKIASMLIAYRYSKKKTQTDIANILKVTFQQVQKFEKAINKIDAIKLLEFCEALNIPLNQFQIGDAYQILDGADISILTKEKAMSKIDKLEENYNDKSRSNEDMVGKSIGTRAYI